MSVGVLGADRTVSEEVVIYDLCDPDTFEVWLRQQAHAGRSQKEMADELGVSPQVAWYAITGKTWKHVAERPLAASPKQRLTDDQVASIRGLVRAGVRRGDVARYFGITTSYLSQLVTAARRKPLTKE